MFYHENAPVLLNGMGNILVSLAKRDVEKEPEHSVFSENKSPPPQHDSGRESNHVNALRAPGTMALPWAL